MGTIFGSSHKNLFITTHTPSLSEMCWRWQCHTVWMRVIEDSCPTLTITRVRKILLSCDAIEWLGLLVTTAGITY